MPPVFQKDRTPRARCSRGKRNLGTIRVHFELLQEGVLRRATHKFIEGEAYCSCVGCFERRVKRSFFFAHAGPFWGSERGCAANGRSSCGDRFCRAIVVEQQSRYPALRPFSIRIGTQRVSR
jgi:hypothetical protein